MNKRELKKFEKLLQAERRRLDGSIRNIEESSRHEKTRESGGDFASYAESGTDNFAQETALNIAGGESEWLNEVSDALMRVQSGAYGGCEGCEEETRTPSNRETESAKIFQRPCCVRRQARSFPLPMSW